MKTFDRYGNILRVNDRIIVPPRKDEIIDPPCLSIWEVTEVIEDGTVICVCLTDTYVEVIFFPNEIIKV